MVYLWFAAIFARTCLAALPPDCAAPLGKADPIRDFRTALIRSSRAYGAEYPQRNTSLFRGNEYRWLEPSHKAPSHMIYIASGADLFRPLIDYPLVDHYHFMDRLTGWGHSPAHLLYSLRHRLESISTQVAVDSLGFLEQMMDFVPSEFGVTSGFDWLNRHESQNLNADKPLILTADVRLPGGGTIKKHLYLHAADRNSDSDIEGVLRTIPSTHPLEGILHAGLSGSPSRPSMHTLLDRLDPGAWFLLELGEETPTADKIDEIVGPVREEIETFLETKLQIRVTPPYRIRPRWQHGMQRTAVVWIRKS